MKKQSKACSNLALLTAHTPEEHIAVFKRYGVLWWWKLKTEPLWNERTVLERVGGKENGNSPADSRNSFEGAPERRVRLAIWPFHVLFLYRYERSAFLYEMNARITGKFEKYEFDKPWCYLNQEQIESLAKRWPMATAAMTEYEMRRYICTVARPGTKPNAGWTAFQNISWNLHHNNAKLIREFKARIAFERERLGQKPRVNQGTRHRALSWRPIELLDEKQFEHKDLSDGDRSQIFKAIREAKRVFNSTSN